ncbi:fibropellin-1-like [Actinia tenebrosa]|uniref:Fibropellin-1-like n=1 Tax=Actinia tenebrosa TaxID=6105 RepID=A0A6P8I8G8_ACTTE|nr:fibropellin-1-like [Actinia tenebrosa]
MNNKSMRFLLGTILCFFVALVQIDIISSKSLTEKKFSRFSHHEKRSHNNRHTVKRNAHHKSTKRQFLPFYGGMYSSFNHQSHPHIHRIVVHHHPEHSFCQPEPCQNGGTCTVVSHGHECTCSPGFMGTHCELRSQCEPNPCKNGATCYDVGQGYECTCAKGFKGDNCEDINKCHPNPCRNGGMCTGTNNAKGYECTCREGFKGSDCEEINLCVPSPCKNGGTCTERGGGRYECTCPIGFKGVTCEERSICFSNPCLHGGSCVDEMYGYRCSCRLGYNGINCQNHVCSPNPCENGGNCLEEEGHAHCVCQTGYHGAHCEMVSACVSHPCLHGGTCIDTSFIGHRPTDSSLMYGSVAVRPNSQSFICKCQSPYAGPMCEDDRCKYCSPHADCILGHCVCKESYHGDGKTCNKNVCHPNPCKNGASCIPADSSFDCECVKGWTGPLCEVKQYCVPNPCQNGGQCVALESSYKCICLSNFEGNNCEKGNPCYPNPCKNGGTCLEMNGAANCECEAQFEGNMCEIDKCARCDSHASCVNGKCVCNEGYEGDGETCTAKTGPGGSPGVVGRTSACASNPCQNGGVCLDTDNGFTCMCKEGFKGTLCELGTGTGASDPCTPNPCKNNGNCQNVDGKAKCLCAEGFQGELCELPIGTGGPDGGKSKCHPNPCLNGGACHENGGGYDCVCLPQYSGPNCEIDECEKCDVNAICVRGNCRCRTGYIGNGYECEKEEAECDGCSPHAHCLKGICVCVDHYIGNGYHCQPTSCTNCPTSCVNGACVPQAGKRSKIQHKTKQKTLKP